MSKKVTLKPIAAALGTTFAVSLAASPIANANDNPFSMAELTNGGYMVAGKDAEGKCGEAKCGADKKMKMEEEEKMDSEGKCGEDKKMEEEKMDSEGKCGESKNEKMESEGKCGN